MKIKELIDLLKRYDENTLVVIDGYEGGIEDITEEGVRLIDLDLNHRTSDSYSGPHEEVTSSYEYSEIDITIDCKAVIIER